jgi:hypothetical protein
MPRDLYIPPQAMEVFLDAGADKARATAGETMRVVRGAMNLLPKPGVAP